MTYPPSSPRPPAYRPTPPRPVQPRPPYPSAQPPRRAASGSGCLSGFFLGFSLFLVAVLTALAVALLAYAALARDLPPADELVQRASQFQTTRIYARDGQVLQEPLAPDDPRAGLRRRVPLSQISPYLIQATVATEDANFYRHRGVDPVALLRAVYNAVRTQGPVAGTSTISQQLVKLVFLSPERTLSRKLKEAVLAAEITRRYDKDTILELYLNEVYYGHLAYGAEAAARIYFNTSARDLTLAQAALLAGLPQSPAFYDPLQNPQAAKRRQADVLRLMVEAGYITPAEADAAWQEDLQYYGQGLDAVRLTKAPHFVMYVRSQIEQLYGPEMLYRGGLQVYTTLDLGLQEAAEAEVRAGVARLRDRQVSNAALVAIRPQTGEILSMVGSADFFDQEIDGQVNVALAMRQPGSAIKPFTYLATFEMAQDWWTPATLVEDVRTEFPDGPGRPPYVPRNYDGKFHGWVSVRSALANSYNIPAVKALQHAGIPALLDVSRRFGLDTLVRPGHPPYGLALTLGGGEVTLLELTGAYAALANGGVRVPPAAILCVLNADGQVLERLEVPGLPAACRDAPLAPGAVVQPPPQSVATAARYAYLITDILKDDEARAPVFGRNSKLNLGRPAAAKTGTSNDVRDGWTVGYTPDLATGVWMGNSDGSPMDQLLSGSAGAAVIWNAYMTRALANVPPRNFPVPEGVVRLEVCALTGALPDPSCPPDQRRMEVFAADRLPPGADAAAFQVSITEPRDGETREGVIPVMGSAKVPNFDHYLVEYGETFEPGAWGVVAGPVYQPVENGLLAQWDLRGLPKDGPHVVRVVAVDKSGRRYESPAVRIYVRLPATPTPEATETPTPLPTPTETPLPEATPTPTPTPGPPTPTPTPAAPSLFGRLIPPPGGVFFGLADIEGEAGGDDFSGYRVEFSADGVIWLPVNPQAPEVFSPTSGVLANWDTTLVPNGIYTLRLLVQGWSGAAVVDTLTVRIAN
ncbi:MAG: PBP1A family penicillin-binding protein [Caldilineales bacterium]|nr:PBP1A family penicillin-binding protein [Caldilineales bacterium]